MTQNDSIFMTDNLADDIEKIRKMGQIFLEAILSYWETTKSGSVYPVDSLEMLQSLSNDELPERGKSIQELIDRCKQTLEVGITKVASPRYLGMMNPPPSLVAVFSEALEAAYNQNCSLYHQSPAASEVEKVVIKWLCSLMGYHQSAFGVLVSGGSIANITALKLARNHALGNDVSIKGLRNAPIMNIYVSREAHYSFEKAMDFIGIGTEHLKLVPTHMDFSIDETALKEMIEKDISSGTKCGCIIGIAGTTNTGSVDPIEKLGRIAKQYGAWFHVDAAYGGAAAILEEKANLFRGLSLADSITVDPHKWFFIPYESAALLVKDKNTLRSNFKVKPHYYLEQDDNIDDKVNFFEYGLQGSRSFKALKIWLTFQFFGMEFYKKIVRMNISFASHLSNLIKSDPRFEALHEPKLGIFCFRALPDKGDYTRDEIDGLNRRIHKRIEKNGRFWIAITKLSNIGVSLRVNFENYRTRLFDVDELYKELIKAREMEIEKK